MDLGGFDLKAYYAEQEERMRIPDETVDEFMKRASIFRRSSGSFGDASSSRIRYYESSVQMEDAQSHNIVEPPNPLPASAAPSCTTFESSKIPLDESLHDSGRNMKRKASELQQVEAAASKRKRVADQDNGSKIIFDVPDIDPSNPAQEGRQPDKDLQPQSQSKHERSQGLELEEIDSFTVDVCDEQLPVKRKALPMRQSPQKRRQIATSRSPQRLTITTAADNSPISSFSKSRIEITPQKGEVARKGPVPTAKNPPLNLLPLREIELTRQPSKNKIKHASPTSESLFSPIEDSSLPLPAQSPTRKRKALEAESSDLYLEVKERIAKHSSTKKLQRDKVAKLPTSRQVIPKATTSKAASLLGDESSIIYVSSSPSSRAASPVPSGAAASSKEKKKLSQKKTELKETKPKIEKHRPRGKTGREKERRLTPYEYAKTLISAQSTSAMKSESLAGMNIFYTGGDMQTASEATRAKMRIIVENSGNLMPSFDPNVTTHIITDAASLTTLKALGLNRLNEIPDRIPTVKWDWVFAVIDMDKSLSQEEMDARLRRKSFHYAAFSDRLDAGYSPIKPTRTAASFRMKTKEKVVDKPQNEHPLPSTSSLSAAQTYASTSSGPNNGAPLSPPSSPIRPPKSHASKQSATIHIKGKGRLVDDPLAEFYDQARVQKQQTDDGWSSLGELGMEGSEGDETDDDDPLVQAAPPIPRSKRGWTCDTKEPKKTGDCPNQDIIDKLTELMELHKAKLGDEDHWRAFTYSKCIRALKNHPRRITSLAEARTIRGVGEKTAKKILEIIQTGDLRRIKYETTKDVEVTRLFQGIYGVGRSIAFKWYSAGCRTLEDLKNGKGGVKLSNVQQIGLKYYDDINDRMPRAEAKAIFELIKPIALAIDPHLFVEIMGSYRRGKSDCGDIDILITRPTDDGHTHSEGVIPCLLQDLHRAGILTEDLALPDDAYDLETTYRGLCSLPGVYGAKRRRIDILCVPWSSRGAALLYYTGDDIFNRAMRLKANVLGYSLNQRGLFGNVVRDPRDRRIKLNDGVLVASETEEEIFKILGVPWQEPHERVRG